MLTHAVDRAAIRHHPILSSLTDEQFEELGAQLSATRHAAQHVLFQAGDPARHFFIVLEGQVRLFVQSRSGQEKIVDVIHPGQTFAEALMFLDAPRYPVSAQAVEESLVLAVPNGPFLRILRDSPETSLRLLADLSVRLHQLVGEIERLTLASATHRLVRHLVDQLPESTDLVSRITLRESRQDLASRLGMKPETLSRILRSLSDEGAIEVDGREVRIPDRRRLDAVLERAD
jgi:CRP-like cAMP-binding protein